MNDQKEFSKPHILLVDDNQDILMVIKMSLELLGYEVSEFLNGRDAIEQFKSIQPSAAIIDQGLPDILGLDVGRKFREMDPTNSIPLILLTGTDGQAIREQANEAGFNDFLVKPVRINVLSDCVKRTLNAN